MDENVLKLGDEVFVLPSEGQLLPISGTVIGFSEMPYGRIHNLGFKPGIYWNKIYSHIRFDNGEVQNVIYNRIELVDAIEYHRRLDEMQSVRASDWRAQYERVRDLPETPFWEGDLVRAKAISGVVVVTSQMPPESVPEIWIVTHIDYSHLSDLTDPGTKWPGYDISDKMDAGWSVSASEDDLELVERGKVWKFYHNEPIEFVDIKEEANFFLMLGHTDDVRNPENGLFKWTKRQVLRAIKKGIVHGFTVRGALFGPKPSIEAYVFRNPDLGRRVAEATLAGFNVS